MTADIQNAQEFENSKRDQTGSAIAWYLKALKIYPDSEMAEEGFQRLLDKVLPENGLLPPPARSNTETSLDPVDRTVN